MGCSDSRGVQDSKMHQARPTQLQEGDARGAECGMGSGLGRIPQAPARSGDALALTFPEVPSPSTTILSCLSWQSSSESDMLLMADGAGCPGKETQLLLLLLLLLEGNKDTPPKQRGPLQGRGRRRRPPRSKQDPPRPGISAIAGRNWDESVSRRHFTRP